MIGNITDFSGAGSAMQSVNFNSTQAKTSGFEQALNAAAQNGDDEKLMDAAREFESYFLQMMLKEMRSSIPKDGLIPKSNAQEIFTSMLDEEYAKNAAKGQGIGLARTIFEQMTKQGGSLDLNALTAATGTAAAKQTANNAGETAADSVAAKPNAADITEN